MLLMSSSPSITNFFPLASDRPCGFPKVNHKSTAVRKNPFVTPTKQKSPLKIKTSSAKPVKFKLPSTNDGKKKGRSYIHYIQAIKIYIKPFIVHLYNEWQ